MKKVIKGISYVLSFVLMICIIAIIAINIVKSKILNKEYIVKSLDDVNYYSHVSENIDNGFENYYYQSGLEHYVIENLYDENKVKADTMQLIDAIYNNTELNIETDSIKEKLRANIDDMLEKQNKKIESSEKETVETFINLIADTYKSEITIYESGIKLISKVISNIEKIMNKFNQIVIIITIIIFIAIAVINIKSLTDVANYYGISIFASGLICLILKIGINSFININKLFTLSKSVTELIKFVLLDILGKVQMDSIILLLIGIALIFLNAVIKNKQEQI